jgi:hypothetical protein
MYPLSSPYYSTKIANNQFLEIMSNRPIIMNPTDVFWTIIPTYNLRPDLLAYDLYDDAKLWWVFAQRNPNILKDPLFDFVQGIGIYIPTKDALVTSLGI